MVCSRVLMGVLVLVAAGCETYEGRLQGVHESFYSGKLAEAEQGLREGVAGASHKDQTLLQLELATVLQARGRYAEAAELLTAADDLLEVLDYSAAPINEMAEFAFAVDDVWRASPPERAMINIQNMINYLAAGELGSAEVEARRLKTLVTRSDLSEAERYGNPFGWGLAGLILEASGDLEVAQEAFSQLPDGSGLRPPADRAGQGTILVVCQLGQAPIRRQARYWISTGGAPHQLNIPVMQERPGGSSSASVTLDGVSQGEVPMLFDLGEHLMRLYEVEFPRLVAAAVVQVVPRALGGKVVGKGVEAALAEEAESEEEAEADKLIGDLVGFLFETAAAAVQVADVRCWSLLPGRFGALRLDVEPGAHTVSVALAGGGLPLQLSVDVAAGQLVLVNVVSGPGDGYRSLPDPRGSDLTHQPEGLEVLRLLEEASWLVNEID